MASTWGSSWGSSWGNSWGVIASSSGGSGHKKKPPKGPPVYSAHEPFRVLADVRQIQIDKILAERRAEEAITEHEVTAPPDKPKPVLLAGGRLVPPVAPPAATKIGEIAPELAMFKASLEEKSTDEKENQMRRLLLLLAY